jgi:hypothetical protein
VAEEGVQYIKRATAYIEPAARAVEASFAPPQSI